MNPEMKNGNGGEDGIANDEGGGAGILPTAILRFEHIERRKSNAFNLDTRALDQLEKYTLYIKELKGFAPLKDEVVEKALLHIFNLDAGFKRYLASGTTTKQIALGKGRKSGKASATSAQEQSESELEAAGNQNGSTAHGTSAGGNGKPTAAATTLAA